MDQRNNRRHPGRGWGPQFGAAPQLMHPHLLHHQLQMALQDNPRYAEQRDERQAEQQKLCYRIHKLKYEINRVQQLMEHRETEFKAELLRNRKNIGARESEISSLQQELKLQTDQIFAIQNQAVQEKDGMVASLESERRKVSEQDAELLYLRLESQKNVLLQNQLQIKVHQLEEQLLNKDQELLVLKKKTESLSCSTLQPNENENVLLEKSTVQPEESEDRSEGQGGEDKKALKKDRKKEKKRGKERKAKEAKEEKKRKEKEEKELKKQQKEEKREMKKKEKQAEAEMKQKEKEEKKRAKEEKEEKGFWHWMQNK